MMQKKELRDREGYRDVSPARGFAISAERFEAPPLDPGLYIVATPIGNLRDITLRALEVLAAADLIACEDTRVTRTLLDRYGIRTRRLSYHEHNAAKVRPRLLAELVSGRSVALVSDAGTPLVSDPGYRLVAAALDAGIAVVPVPGASAALAALVVSGLPSDAFLFLGFLPAKSGARRQRIARYADVEATLILYESPQRLTGALNDLADALGPDRTAAIARELTKRYEEVRRGTLGELAAAIAEAPPPKGEIVIVIAPPAPGEGLEFDLDALLTAALSRTSLKDAVAEIAAMTGLARKTVYARALELRGETK